MAIRRRRRAVPPLAVALVLVLGGILVACDTELDDDDGDPEAQDASDADPGTRPDTEGLVPADDSDPPTELGVEDVVVGDGSEAGEGDRLTMHYVGVRWSDGGEFDASWERGAPFAFTLGAGEVIEGWDVGVVGMREGGRRILTVPAELAYGDRSVAGAFDAGETLVFVVDLIAVDP